jgi:ribosome-binding protein aMBF1 (putative translation factor)
MEGGYTVEQGRERRGDDVAEWVIREAERVLKGETMDNQPAGRRLGQHLRALREAREWSLEYVSRELDISLARLQTIETDRKSIPEPELLEKLAALYGTTQAELLAAAGYKTAPVTLVR